MNVNVVISIVAAVAVVCAALISAPRLGRDPLIALHKLIDIHNALPDSSAAKAAILRRIEQQVGQLDTQDTARRNPIGVTLGVLLLVVAGAASWLVATAGAWWWLTAPGVALLWAAGFIGIGQSFASVPRAANGQSLEYQANQAAKHAGRAH